MFEYPVPKLPDFSYSTSGLYTYVRISVKAPEGSGRKRTYKTVGKINSSKGSGKIVFTEEFLQQYPSLMYFEVSKVDDWHLFELETDDGNVNGDLYPLVFKPNPFIQPLRPQLSCMSIGYALWCQRILQGDPLPRILMKCFPKTHRSFLAAACFKALNLMSGTFGLENYKTMAVLPFDEDLTDSKWSDLKAGLDDESLSKFFKLCTPEYGGRIRLYLLRPIPAFPFALAMWFAGNYPVGFELLDIQKLHGSVLMTALEHAPHFPGLKRVIPTVITDRKFVTVENGAFLRRRIDGLMVCDARVTDFTVKKEFPVSPFTTIPDDLKDLIAPDTMAAFEAKSTKIPDFNLDAFIMPPDEKGYCLLSTEGLHDSWQFLDRYLKLSKLYQDLTVLPAPFYDKEEILSKLKADLFELMLALHVKNLIEECLSPRDPDFPDDSDIDLSEYSQDEILQFLHRIKVLTNKESGRKFILPLDEKEACL